MSQYPSVPTSQYRNILYISISLYISFPFYFFYLFCLYYYYTLSPFAASCFPLVSSYYCLVLPSLLSTVLYSQIIMDETDHGFNQPSGHSEGSNPKRRNRKKLLIVLIFFLLYAFKNLYFIKDDGVIWGIIGGIVPDLLVALYMLTKSRALKWFFNFHRFMHHLFVDRLKNDIPLKVGLIMQMIIFATLVVLLHEVALGGPLL